MIKEGGGNLSCCCCLNILLKLSVPWFSHLQNVNTNLQIVVRIICDKIFKVLSITFGTR